MALIKCPECGREISETVDVCINCGYQIKPKKKVDKKILIVILACIILVSVLGLVVTVISKKETYPELMKVLNCSYVSDAKELLGNDYEIMSSSTAKFYQYNDLELDDVLYETVHITELLDGSLYEIGFEFSIDDLEELEKYVKDISKSYGDCIKNTDYYDWKTSKSLNPVIYIHGKESPYIIILNLN